MFSVMLMDAYRDERPGVRIAYRTDGHLMNQRRMYFQSRVSTTTVHELLFHDDCARNTTSEEEMQRRMDLFSTACENFGLVINTQKTMVMHQPPPNSVTDPNAPQQISVNGTQLQVVENLPYLGSTLSRNTEIDEEEELARDRPTWRRTVKTGAAIHEANRISAAKAKREARKSQLRSVSNAAAQPLPTCPRCQRTFRARIGLVGHLRIICNSRTAPNFIPPPASSSSSLPPTNSDNSSAPPLPSSSSFSSSSSSSSSSPPPPPLSPPPSPLPQRRPLRQPSRTSPTATQQPAPPKPLPTPAMRIRTTPALSAIAPSPHLSAWSVTREFIAQRPANQCLEHQPTPTALGSTAHTVLAPSRIAWIYSATCASTRAELTTIPTRQLRPSCPTPPSHRPSAPPPTPPL
nr:unnamed protein product [Spirometra erinaceieuropaei]